MDRVLDPPAVAALLGIITSLKGKLSALAIPQVRIYIVLLRSRKHSVIFYTVTGPQGSLPGSNSLFTRSSLREA